MECYVTITNYVVEDYGKTFTINSWKHYIIIKFELLELKWVWKYTESPLN